MKSERNIKKIEEFLQDITFSKTLLGANQSDVFACLKEVSGMYEDVIKSLEEEYEEEIADLKKELLEKDALMLREQQKNRQAAAAPIAANTSNERAESIIANLRAQLDASQSSNNEYQMKLEQLALIIEKQQQAKAEVCDRAEREGRMILVEAKKRADTIVSEAREQAQQERLRAQDAVAEAARLRESIQGNLRLIAADLTSMSSDVEELRSKVCALPDEEEHTAMQVPKLSDILNRQ